MSDERELPPPEHTSRDPWPPGVPVPSVALKLQRGAEAAGWAVSVTYSRAWALPHAQALPPYKIATVAVRFRRTVGDHVRRGYVVYHCRLDRAPKWEPKGLMLSGSDHWPVITGLTVTELGRYLVDGPDWTGAEVDAWRDRLKLELATKKAEEAKRAKVRAKKGKVI